MHPSEEEYRPIRNAAMLKLGAPHKPYQYTPVAKRVIVQTRE